eukprot:CAMPEP_0115610912 /NCGR_PEP_ID=MMETSP0272-20121206/20264_1 /TAXON_ID=71861 /ORGANISM="Scrippsiella trochoidea, Strain CCMP3099" /LENGTH=87 /DNA_ID=CAMNT_0003046633 /DNA_START=276 /DNA_END=535 /DNA_ORIENTATION=+
MAPTALPLWPIGQAPFLPVIGQRGASSSSLAPAAASGSLSMPSIMAVQGHLPGLPSPWHLSVSLLPFSGLLLLPSIMAVQGHLPGST